MIIDAKQRFLRDSVINKMTPEQATQSLEMAKVDLLPKMRGEDGYQNYKKQQVLDYSKQYPAMAPLIANPAMSALTTQNINDVAMMAKTAKEYETLTSNIKNAEVSFGGTVGDFYERRNLQDRRNKAFVLISKTEETKLLF